MLPLVKKIEKARKRPTLIKIRALNYFFGKLGLFQKKYKWLGVGTQLKQKMYGSYSEYVAHQQGKLEKMDLFEYDKKYYTALKERLAALVTKGVINNGNVALCLAARIGTEVRCFLDYGCFAVGIDLNPGKSNLCVLYGDFHNIQFPKNSADIIFTNSLDHSLSLDRLASEIERVLKPEGYLILEVEHGTEEGGSFGYYEAFSWRKVDDCLKPFIDRGFSILQREDFSYPWSGEHIVLRNHSK